MTESQLREERRALLTWFTRNAATKCPAHWQRNIDRFKEVSFKLHQMTGNPIFKSRT